LRKIIISKNHLFLILTNRNQKVNKFSPSEPARRAGELKNEQEKRRQAGAKPPPAESHLFKFFSLIYGLNLVRLRRKFESV